MNDHSLLRNYDYFDFGCSSGANLLFNDNVFPGLRGIGIDIDANKIQLARKSGHEAILFNILELPEEKLVKFVTMSHFLEHLDSVEMARRMIVKAISVARDFIFIRQPWFDSDGLLFLLGYKFYWSHWRGHRNKMTILDFHSLLMPEKAKGRIRRFAIFGRGEVSEGADPSLLPVEAPIDQHKYQKDLHGPKNVQKLLPFAAYREVLVCVDIADTGNMGAIMKKLGRSHLLYRSDASFSITHHVEGCGPRT